MKKNKQKLKARLNGKDLKKCTISYIQIRNRLSLSRINRKIEMTIELDESELDNLHFLFNHLWHASCFDVIIQERR